MLTGRSKLAARYTGPARIVRVLTPVSFIVRDNDGHQFQVHSRFLKPVYQRIGGGTWRLGKAKALPEFGSVRLSLTPF